MSDKTTDSLNAELREAGEAVARLPRPQAPAGLVQRTLERVAQLKPLRRRPLFLRPITHPVARIAAVVFLMVMTVPLTDADTADSLGWRIENNVVGPRVVDHMEAFVDGMLVRMDLDTRFQTDHDAPRGKNYTPPAKRSTRSKPHSRV